MTTYLGKSCSFGLPRVPFVNCGQFMYLVISLLILRAGCGIWLYQFLIIAYLFTFCSWTYSIKPQACHNISVKKPEFFLKCPKSARDDHFSKMPDIARDVHYFFFFKKRKPSFCVRQPFFLFALDIAKHDSTSFYLNYVTGEWKAHGPTGTRTQDLSHTVRTLWPLSYRAT